MPASDRSLPVWACTNCGFWQPYFAAPPSCPVCLDYRHPLPVAPDGWHFLSREDAAARQTVTWEEVRPDIWMFSTAPPLGIGSCGFLVVRETGNIAFEGTGWYSDAALDQIEALGGVRWIAFSHMHVEGALWRVAERFPEAEVVCQAAQLPFAQALPVAWPFDNRAVLDGDAVLLHTGAHTLGHTVLHLPERRVLFCGDALKYKLDDAPVGHALAVSTHKAYDAHIPLTHGDVRRYQAVFGDLDIETVATPWEVVPEGGMDAARRLFDALLARRPTADWFRLADGQFVTDTDLIAQPA